MRLKDSEFSNIQLDRAIDIVYYDDIVYTWIENLSARARCMRTGGSKQIVLSYARPVGHLCAAREELK